MAMDRTHSRCIQVPITQDQIGKATSIFSSPQDGQIPVVLVPAKRRMWSLSLTVPSGTHALGQRFGEHKGKLQPGLRFPWPAWNRVAYIVNSQACQYHAPVKECPTSDNVRVALEIMVTFVVNDPSLFVFRLGAANFDALLSGAVDEAMRMTVRGKDHTEVFGLKGKSSQDLLKSLDKKFEGKGVYFPDCKVTSVVLPTELAGSLQKFTELKKVMEKEEREHEFEANEVKREHERKMESLSRQIEMTEVKMNAEKKHAEIQLERKTVVGEEEKAKEMLVMSQQMEVLKIDMSAKLKRTETEMESVLVEASSKAEADKKGRMVIADLAYEKAQVDAEAEKQRLISLAKALNLEAEAEAKMKSAFTSKRAFELNLREKEILNKLAQKGKYNLIGGHGDDMIDAIMTGHLTTTGASSGGGWFG